MRVVVCILALFSVCLAAPGSSPRITWAGGRIVGGSNAQRGDAPFIVSLQYCLLTICQHSCGASIITPNWLLTAGHCITELPSIGSIYAIAGILNLDDEIEERQRVATTTRIVHPEYQGGVGPHDIALIRLASALLLNRYVQPGQLPQEGAEPVGETLLVGWGSTGGIILPQMPNTLQRVNIPIVPIRDCHTALSDLLNTVDIPLNLDANICTGPLNLGISACSGDSGGPLIQDDQIVGIVSWGITPCGTVGAPSVYTKVSHYIEWITANIQ